VYSNNPSIAWNLLREVNESRDEISGDFTRALSGYVTRLSASKETPSQIAAGVSLVALVSATATRLANISTQSQPLSGTGQGSKSGEEMKELGTQVTRLCNEAAIRVALVIVAASSKGSLEGSLEALCLPVLAAYFRGLEEIPVVFRKCIPDAIVLSVLLIRLATPHSHLSASASKLIAFASCVALRSSRQGHIFFSPSGAGGRGEGKKLGPLDPTPLVRSLITSLYRHISDLARLAAYAPVHESFSDAQLASSIIATLPLDGCGHSRASEALVLATGWGMTLEAGEVSVRYTCGRAIGLAGTLEALFTREIRSVRPGQPFVEDVAIPLGEVFASCERLCDAGAGIERGAGVVHSGTSSAAFQDIAWKSLFSECAESLCKSGLSLLSAAASSDFGASRRFRTLLFRVLQGSLQYAGATPLVQGASSLITPKGRILVLQGVFASLRSVLSGPGVGIPSRDSCPVALSLIQNALETTNTSLGVLVKSLPGDGGVVSSLPLLDCLSTALALVQHAWSLIPDKNRLLLEQRVLVLTGGVSWVDFLASGGATTHHLNSQSDSNEKGGRKRGRGEGESGGSYVRPDLLDVASVSSLSHLFGGTHHAFTLELFGEKSGGEGTSCFSLLSPPCSQALEALLAALLVCPWSGGVISPLHPQILSALTRSLSSTSSPPPFGVESTATPALLLNALSNRLVVAGIPVSILPHDAEQSVKDPSNFGVPHSIQNNSNSNQDILPSNKPMQKPTGFPSHAAVAKESAATSHSPSLIKAYEKSSPGDVLTEDNIPPSTGPTAISITQANSQVSHSAQWVYPPSAAAASPANSLLGAQGGSKLSQGDVSRLAEYADALGDDFPSYL